MHTRGSYLHEHVYIYTCNTHLFIYQDTLLPPSLSLPPSLLSSLPPLLPPLIPPSLLPSFPLSPSSTLPHFLPHSLPPPLSLPPSLLNRSVSGVHLKCTSMHCTCTVPLTGNLTHAHYTRATRVRQIASRLRLHRDTQSRSRIQTLRYGPTSVRGYKDGSTKAHTPLRYRTSGGSLFHTGRENRVPRLYDAHTRQQG